VAGRGAYRVLRQSFGGAILLGLEIQVAADLVRTVAVEPTLENVEILGLIVLIRDRAELLPGDRDRRGGSVEARRHDRRRPDHPGREERR
jgi:hypothetical protein